jgi:hypothetical protein
LSFFLLYGGGFGEVVLDEKKKKERLLDDVYLGDPGLSPDFRSDTSSVLLVLTLYSSLSLLSSPFNLPYDFFIYTREAGGEVEEGNKNICISATSSTLSKKVLSCV